MDPRLEGLHRDTLARVCRRTLERCEAGHPAEDVFRRHHVEFIEVYDEMRCEPETVRAVGPIDLDNQCGDGPYRGPDIAAMEIAGILRKSRDAAESGAIPAHEVAILCLEKLRGVGRRHDISGCSDREIDDAIAVLRSHQPAN